MNLFTKQEQTHRLRKQTHDYQRGKVGGGINQEFGNVVLYGTLLYIKYVINKDLLYLLHRELYSIQLYSVITYMGKESENEQIHVHV